MVIIWINEIAPAVLYASVDYRKRIPYRVLMIPALLASLRQVCVVSPSARSFLREEKPIRHDVKKCF